MHHAEKAHKRIAALDLVNQQMKVYFRLNTIRLSAALVSAIEGTRALPFESFPASARVTYKYYTGRIAVFDENFVSPFAWQFLLQEGSRFYIASFILDQGVCLQICVHMVPLPGSFMWLTAILLPVKAHKHLSNMKQEILLHSQLKQELYLGLVNVRRKRQKRTCCMR